jgi:hypothetical protein
VAQGSEPIVAQAQRAHPGGQGRGLTGAGSAGGPGPVPGVDRGAIELAVGVPAKREGGRLVRPIGIAPAALRRSTTGASSVGKAPTSALAPCVVGVPTRSMSPLTVNGTPWNGGKGSPSATRRSAAGGPG